MLHAGRVLERFVVEGEIGRGGMATVYRIRHLELGTAHALKVLWVTGDQVRERLVQEGRIQASLRHPNVVSVTDVLNVDGAPGLVMELVDGVSLEQVLATRRLTGPQADAVAVGLLSGVAEAHRHGLVHRDLKPGNVLLARDSAGLVVKVTDFGLARVLSDDVATHRRTAAGATFGTPGYMAPEQFGDTRGADARADVFSLGAVLYEIASGRRAFAGDDLFGLADAARAGRFTPLSELAPDLPAARQELVTRCLLPDPAGRPADAGEILKGWTGAELLLDSAADLLDEMPPPAPPRTVTSAPVPAERGLGRVAIGSVVVVGLVVAALLASRWTRTDRVPPVAPLERARAVAMTEALLPSLDGSALPDLVAARLGDMDTEATRARARELAGDIAEI